MNIRPFVVWLACANGHPFTWHLSRSAAFAERRRLNGAHPHARWTVATSDAELLLGNPNLEEVRTQ